VRKGDSVLFNIGQTIVGGSEQFSDYLSKNRGDGTNSVVCEQIHASWSKFCGL